MKKSSEITEQVLDTLHVLQSLLGTASGLFRLDNLRNLTGLVCTFPIKAY